MPLNRRAVLALGLGMISPFPALAAAPPESQSLESLLSQAPWIADGEPSRRHVYVLFAPWCPVCKLLFQRTRSARGGVQLRWIAGGSRDDQSMNQNLNIVSNRSLDVLTHVFQQMPIEDLSKDRPAMLRLVLSEMTIKEVAKRIEVPGYPTLIFIDGRGRDQSIAGVPSDLDAVFAQVGMSAKE